MSTLVDFSWSQGRSVQSWGTSAPSGNWYRDDSDPSFSNGVTVVYKALPFWLGLDFHHTAAGGLLVMVNGPTDDATRGRLRIYRGTTPEPATLTDYVELENSEVSGAAMGVRASGEVDVFYVHSGVLKHRKSDDGGVTFGTADDLVLLGAGSVAFTPAVVSSTVGSTSPSGATVSTEFLHFAYLATGGIGMLIFGRLSGAAFDQTHIVRADWDGSAWAFQTVGVGTGISAGPIHALRDGDLFTVNGCRKIKKLTNSGTFTLGLTAGGNLLPGGTSEELNQHLAGFTTDGNDSDGSGTYGGRRLEAYSLNAAGTSWVATGRAANTDAEKLKAWRLTFVITPNTGNWRTRAGRARLRRDGRWEYLYLNRDQKPEIIRFEKITAAVTPLTWY